MSTPHFVFAVGFIFAGAAVACSAPVDGPATSSADALRVSAPAQGGAATTTATTATTTTTTTGAATNKPGTTCVESAPPTSVAPTPTDAIQTALDAWAATNAEAAAAAAVVGRACVTNDDCATLDAAFPGTCQTPYYGQAQCAVPSAPAEPVFTCADWTCPAGFQCEQEGSASVACVHHEFTCTTTTVPTGGGGGGNGNHGGRAN